MNKTKFFPFFYRRVFLNWKKRIAMMTEITSEIPRWISFCLELFSGKGSIKQWHDFMRKFNPHEIFYVQWLQLIDLLPERWNIFSKKTLKMLLML